ncbi:MAG: hypothetical protein EPN75_07980 [Beijerinckiaceae bacterium]|nr:MAG: hypothetical protein EPN75_07980 [Beijerinckiaceae bacterium]
MAGDGEADKDRGGSDKRRRGSTAPPRENAVIEGEIIKSDTPAAESQKSEATADAPASPERALSASGETEAATAGEPGEPASDGAVNPAAERPRASAWPVAAAIVIGAAIAAGGAYGLHQLDQPSNDSSALAARVAALEHAQTNPAPAPQPAAPDLTAINKRIDGLEAAGQAQKTDLAHIQQDMSQLSAELKQAQQHLAANASKPASVPVNLAPLTARIGKLDKEVASFNQALAASATKRETEITSLTSGIAGLKSEIDSVRAEKKAAAQAAMAHAEADARAILAAGLRSKVDSGEGFADNLSALGNHGVDPAKLSALKPFADTGVATQAALAAQLSALAPALVATKPTPKGEGFLARIASDAKHLVRIQKIGDTKGNDPAARVARISADLSAGKLKEALQEWKALPDAARAKSQAFATALQHRIAAVEAAQQIEAEALAGLAKVKS